MSKGNSLLDKLKKINATSEIAVTRVNEMNQVEEKRPREPRSEVIENKVIRPKTYALKGNLGVDRVKQRSTIEQSYIDGINSSLLLLGRLLTSEYGVEDSRFSKFFYLLASGYGPRLNLLFKRIVEDFKVDGNPFPKFKGTYLNSIGGYSRAADTGVTTYRYSSELTNYLIDTEKFLESVDLQFTYVPLNENKERKFISLLQTYTELFEDAGSNKIKLIKLINDMALLPYKIVNNKPIYITDAILHESFRDLVVETRNVGLLQSLEVGGFNELYIPIGVLEETLNEILGPDNWITLTSNVFKLPCSLKDMAKKKDMIKKIERVTSVDDKKAIYLCRCIYIDVLGNCKYVQVETIPSYGAEENGIVTIKNLARRAAITQTFKALESIRGSNKEEISGEQLELVQLLDGILGTSRTIGFGKTRDKFLSNMMNRIMNGNVKDITKPEIQGPEGDLITQGFNKLTVNKQLQLEGGRNTIRIEDLVEDIKQKKEMSDKEKQQRRLQLLSSTKQPMEIENTTQMEEEQSHREEKED